MSLSIINATLFHLDPVRIECGAIRAVGNRIDAAGTGVTAQPGDDVIDAGGAVVLPGLVNGHTHLYSALAAGMPMPPIAPADFHEILKFIWWRLDRAMDAESIEVSARIGAMDAMACGTTTLIDHHASPNHIDGSLDLLERGIAEVGLRAILCYEVTDRNGPARFEAGLFENRRYLDKLRLNDPNGRFGAMVGAHAAFTLSDKSLLACAGLAEEYRSGLHIHVAEDPCDDKICRQIHGLPLLDRLRNCGLLPPGEAAADSLIARSILGHGTHLSPADAARLSSIAAGIAHNPRSNMNNAVGYAPIRHMTRVMLGTDGIGGDMFNECRTAWFKYRDSCANGDAGLAPARFLDMLAHNARVASGVLGVTLGRLEAGAAADLILTNYVPATPLLSENAPAHFIFAMGPQHIDSVFIDGEAVFRDRTATRVNARAAREHAAHCAAGLWDRMQQLTA
ncbi:MAG: amidohydrolase family protein [Phycisphaerae bacterium]|nr:amidohydrolase family protein [Phycisphaerae bacterium]